MKKSIVQLNTEGLSEPVSIHAFQFGTTAAKSDTYKLTLEQVAAGSRNQEIFWLKRDQSVTPDECVRFNLRFAVNVHNSADLQICLTNNEHHAGTSMLWRWAAPIGFKGKWCAEEQQAPWSDENKDYCINISPSSLGIMVRLIEHDGNASEKCRSIPKNKNPIKKHCCG